MWDYPRPPAIERMGEHVVVEFGGLVVAETRAPWRILETSHPPTYYVPRDDVDPTALVEVAGSSFCEFKGHATYLDVVAPDGRRAERAAWTYRSPTPRYADLASAVAFYPGLMDRCTVDGEVVRSVQGQATGPEGVAFYGGWVTDRVVGPFKGAVVGSSHW